MTNHYITQSQKRYQDSIGSLFRPWDYSPKDVIFLKSSTDVGVQRNGGRNGARYAPQSLLSYLKKLNKLPHINKLTFCECEVASEIEETSNFEVAQKLESKRISDILNASPKSFLCHIGGGHDHIYPLLLSLTNKFSRIIVINIDAHADTRTDLEFHSGTPFRQFDESRLVDFHLFQVGLHSFANSATTLSPLNKGSMSVLWRHDLRQPEKIATFFESIKSFVSNETAVVFSLDADALQGSQVPGVSAVNGNGLTISELESIWRGYRNIDLHHPPIIGIYELNPVYDTLSMLSMRTVGNFLFECFDS